MTGKQALLWLSFVVSLLGLFRLILADPAPVARAPEGADAGIIQEFGRATGAITEP